MGLDQRGCIVQPRPEANWQQEEPRDEARPLDDCASGLNIGSRVKREFHARFWERLGVKFPRATRHKPKFAAPRQFVRLTPDSRLHCEHALIPAHSLHAVTRAAPRCSGSVA